MLTSDVNVTDYRKPEHEIESRFYLRWSPRAFSGEGISEADFFRLIEAARWAPSSYNAQHWRFLYAFKGSSYWNGFLDLVDEFNLRWTQRAAVLMVVASRTTFESSDEPALTHSFDTGAAWQNLALQASSMGLIAHGMQGFDYEKAKIDLNVPENYKVEAMIAVGHPGLIDNLPDELRQRERPSSRMLASEIALEGGFFG